VKKALPEATFGAIYTCINAQALYLNALIFYILHEMIHSRVHAG
jgi:hypothetical protein